MEVRTMGFGTRWIWLIPWLITYQLCAIGHGP